MTDTLDLKILDELKLNSRASFAEIGRKVGLSPSSARERDQRMEESGLTKKFNLEVDFAQLGSFIEAFMLLKIFHGKL